MYKIKGHHHISMVTKNANENNHFYKNVLGLRRVKMTVKPRRSVNVSLILWR